MAEPPVDQAAARRRASPSELVAVPRAGRPARCRRDRAWLARVVDTLKERARDAGRDGRAGRVLPAPAGRRTTRRPPRSSGSRAAPERYAILIKRLEAQEAMDAAGARGALPRSRRRARTQARRPRPAHAHRADRQDREPADLRGGEHPRQARRRVAPAARPPRPRGGARGEAPPARAPRPVRLQRGAALPGRAGHRAVASSARARRQALGLALRGGRIAHVYVSPLERAPATAEIALARARHAAHARGRPPRAVARRVGGLHGRRDPRAARRSLRLLGARSGASACRRAASRSTDVQARVVQAIDRIAAAHPNGDDVLDRRPRRRDQRLPRPLLGLPLSSIWRRARRQLLALRGVAPPRVLVVNDDRPPARRSTSRVGAPPLGPRDERP